MYAALYAVRAAVLLMLTPSVAAQLYDCASGKAGSAACSPQDCYDLTGAEDGDFYCACVYGTGDLIDAKHGARVSTCTMDECSATRCTTYQSFPVGSSAFSNSTPRYTEPTPVGRNICRQMCFLDATCTGYVWDCGPGCIAARAPSAQLGTCHLYTLPLSASDVVAASANCEASYKKPRGASGFPGKCSHDPTGAPVCTAPLQECHDPDTSAPADWECRCVADTTISQRLRAVSATCPPLPMPNPPTPSPATPIPPTPSPATLNPPTPSPATLNPPTPSPATLNPPTPSPPIATATSAPFTPAPATATPGTTASPSTPAPATSAPPTSAPATSAPGTPAPATVTPGTTASPSTPAPATSAPPTSAPATSAPGTPASATATPATPNPSTPSPATPNPSTPSPPTTSPWIATATSAPFTPAPATITPGTTAAQVTPAPEGPSPTPSPVPALALPEKVTETLRSAETTANVAVVGTALVGGGGSPTRLAALTLGCGVAIEYSRALSPLGLVLSGSAALGAVLGNVLLAAAVLVVAGFVVRMAGLRSAAPLAALQVLYQGTAIAAMDLVANSMAASPAVGRVVGLLTAAMCVTVPVIIYRVVMKGVPEKAFVREERTTPCMKFLLSPGEWVNRYAESHWVEKWSSVVRPYKMHVPWFGVVDFVSTLVVAVVIVAQGSTFLSCAVGRMVLALTFVIIQCLELWKWPHLAERNAMFDIMIVGAQALSQAVQAVGYLSEGREAWLFEVSADLLVGAGVVMIVRTVFEVGAYGWVVFSGRRERLQEEAYGSDEEPMELSAFVQTDEGTSDPSTGLFCPQPSVPPETSSVRNDSLSPLLCSLYSPSVTFRAVQHSGQVVQGDTCSSPSGPASPGESGRLSPRRDRAGAVLYPFSRRDRKPPFSPPSVMVASSLRCRPLSPSTSASVLQDQSALPTPRLRSESTSAVSAPSPRLRSDTTATQPRRERLQEEAYGSDEETMELRTVVQTDEGKSDPSTGRFCPQPSVPPETSSVRNASMTPLQGDTCSSPSGPASPGDSGRLSPRRDRAGAVLYPFSRRDRKPTFGPPSVMLASSLRCRPILSPSTSASVLHDQSALPTPRHRSESTTAVSAPSPRLRNTTATQSPAILALV